MTDKLIEQIKADRENDKEPNHGWETGPVIWDQDTGEAAYILVGRKLASMSVHNRISRVPDMEARILADAEALKAAERLAMVAMNTGCATQAGAEQLRAYVNAFHKAGKGGDT